MALLNVTKVKKKVKSLMLNIKSNKNKFINLLFTIKNQLLLKSKKLCLLYIFLYIENIILRPRKINNYSINFERDAEQMFSVISSFAIMLFLDKQSQHVLNRNEREKDRCYVLKILK